MKDVLHLGGEVAAAFIKASCKIEIQLLIAGFHPAFEGFSGDIAGERCAEHVAGTKVNSGEGDFLVFI